MKLFLCLITSIYATHSVNPQSTSPSAKELNNLVKEYNNLFLHTKSVVDQVLTQPDLKSNGLLANIVFDKEVTANNNFVAGRNIEIADAQTDFGLKWVSDATYNFSPGISETEDVFFRSRVSTGLDWVILGEGSMQRKRDANRIFKQQILRDSVQFNLQNNSLALQNRQLFLQHIFDLHRLDILKKYRNILQEQAIYQGKMHKAELVGNADKIKADNELQAADGIIAVYEQHLSKNVPDHLVKQYWNIPYVDAVLPDLSVISVENLLKEEELLVQMQKDLVNNRQKPGDKPSLRAKFRYNYYDNADQVGRSFASVGASLSVPIRFGKDNQSLAYEMATYDNDLYAQKLKLKDRLYSQHKDFYLLKNKLFKLQNEISYVDALLQNEIEVYHKQNKNFSPSKYIEYAGLLIQKKLEVLNVGEQLTQDYVAFKTLSGLNNIDEISTSQNSTTYNVGATYMWKNAFESSINDSLISRLNQVNVDTLLLSPGNNDAKIIDFLYKAQDQNIHVSRLLSENSYAKDTNGVQKLLLKLQTLDQYAFGGIHLNIEPHTFSDYKANIPWYTERMNSIYDTAKQWCDFKNIHLTVSIPMHLPIENAEFLAANNITPYIMAYENTNQQKLLQRTQVLRSTLQNNYVWVLRVSDFSCQQDLLDEVTYLQTNGVTRIALYDFSTVTNMF